MDAIGEYFHRRFAYSNKEDERVSKDVHPVGLVTTARGIGKTRVVVEAAKRFKELVNGEDQKSPYAWMAPIVLTFNTGSRLRPNETGNNT